MTNNKQQVWLVTSWEFMHFFKLKQEIISKLIMFALAIVVMLWQYIKDDQQPIYNIAVPIEMSELKNTEQFHFIKTEKKLNELTSLLESNEESNEESTILWHGALQETDNTQGIKKVTIYSKDKQNWQHDLQKVLAQQYILLYANSLGLAPEQLMVLNQAATFKHHYLDVSIKTDDSPAQTTAVGMIVLLFVAIFTSFGQLFVSITGEKQQRVTEQLYACISPQTWIDGKIFGQMLHAIKAMFTTTITALLGYALMTVVISGKSLDLSMIDWGLLPWLLPFALTGTYLCTAFMAAIAAAIDDPNHSAKTSIMLLPLLPMVITFITMDNPSGWALTFLSFFPLTSFAAMPVKMSLIDVPIWHTFISISLIIMLCFWVRTAAAKLFKMGMSMYGKEPSFKDMMRWVFTKES